MSALFLGLGSNLGDRAEHLRFAVRRLARTPGFRDLRLSRLRQTSPVGGPEQPDFVNAVLQCESSLTPRQVLARLQRVEQMRQRRRICADGPRTLDLDLLLFGAQDIQSDFLTIPHPRMQTRRFVLEPLAELAPRLAFGGTTASACLKSLAD